MRKRRQSRGFSLTEVLLAVGTLAVGMIFISGTFLTGIHFSTIATERTIAAVVADEAFAKVRIYGGANTGWLTRLSANSCTDFKDAKEVINRQIVPLVRDPNEFAYPSTRTLTEKHYYWSALCRHVSSDNRLVQVTVFISRKIGSGINLPMPVKVGVDYYFDAADPTNPIKNRLRIIARPPDASGDKTLINDGYTIADDSTGRLYRVVERYAAPNDAVIELDRDWDDTDLDGNHGINAPGKVWVIQPPVSGGRYPCIGVYQMLIRF